MRGEALALPERADPCLRRQRSPLSLSWESSSDRDRWANGVAREMCGFRDQREKIDGSSGELITTLGGLGQPANRSPAGLDIRQVVRHVSAVNNNICCGWSVMPTAEPRVVRAEHESNRFNLLTPWIYSRMTTLYSGRGLFRCIFPHGAYSRRLGTLGHSFLEFSPTP